MCDRSDICFNLWNIYMGTLDSGSCLFVARHNYMGSGRMDGVEEDSYFVSSDFRETPAKSPNSNQSGPKACHVIARAEGPGKPSLDGLSARKSSVFFNRATLLLRVPGSSPHPAPG